MKILGTAIRSFVAGAAGAAGALVLIGGLAAWAGTAMRRDLRAVVSTLKEEGAE